MRQFINTHAPLILPLLTVRFILYAFTSRTLAFPARPTINTTLPWLNLMHLVHPLARTILPFRHF
jgi:hypothetical protein